MGIGELYRKVLEELRHEIITVDISKPADYNSVDSALAEYKCFDCVFICTPNFTHEQIAYQVADHARIVFVEKPGFKTADSWHTIVNAFPKTKFMMIKNNQYRDIIDNLKILAPHIEIMDVRWLNYDRIPSPGSWFTDKSKSFGGVSRDLMPHLLSIVSAVLPNAYQKYPYIKKKFNQQRWQLSDITNTAYGNIVTNGIYDVDDFSEIELNVGNTQVYLSANWRNMSNDDQSLQIILDNNKRIFYDLGLCPEYAYKIMIQTAIENLGNLDFWQDQLLQDLWIHRMCE